MKQILCAFDKFKGSFTAHEACVVASEAIGGATCCPIADGGEGTVEAVAGVLGGEWREVDVLDPLGRRVVARYLLTAGADGKRTAVMEMSEASGFERCLEGGRDPWVASTFGTGEMMQAAIEEGVEKLLIGIGGSATNDGGSGMARALGWRFLDGSGQEIVKLPEYLSNLKEIDRSAAIAVPEVVVACDVSNPLLGKSGATRVFGPQKGVGVGEMVRHEKRLERLADVVGGDLREVPGTGAAGGLGFGLVAFCGARLVGGFEMVAELVGLMEKMEKVDIVLTGEGSLDRQSLEGGKGPVGVAKMARKMGKPVFGFAGRVERGVGIEDVFDGIWEIKPEGWSVEKSIAAGSRLLGNAVRERSQEMLEG